MTETREQTEKRILILCVDRDGDLGSKAGVKTPLIGKKVNLDAAVSLALHDPEEADANAMFEAISLYDRLLNEAEPGEIVEISTICGSELGGVSADRKLVAELNFVLSSFGANEVILVTDGYSDESILPLVESRVPVSSVRRIVVKHSESIEESAAIFSRYLKMLVSTPKYSRIALGIPGMLFVLWVICWFENWTNFYFIAIIVVLGVFMLIKGFGVDRTAKNFYTWAKEYSPPSLPVQVANYTTIAGVLCIAISVYSGYTSTAGAFGRIEPALSDLGAWIGALPGLSGYFLKGAIDLIVVGLATVLFGRGIRLYFEHDMRVLRNVVLIVSISWSRWIFDGAADVLISPDLGYANLIWSIVVGILIAIASVLMILIVNRSAKGFFAESKTKVDEF
jgi:putative membrane protein